MCDLLYIQEWDHSRHVNYLLLVCALPADIREDLSSEDSPGEFGAHVRLVLENMVQAFEMQTTRLRIKQLQEALQKLTKKSKRPTFKRSLQFSSEAISID